MESLTSILIYSVFVVWSKTSFTFLCSKDFLRISDGMGKSSDNCGNKTGQNISIEDEVEITFHSDEEIERRGYLLKFALVSLPSVSSGKWNHKEADKT